MSNPRQFFHDRLLKTIGNSNLLAEKKTSLHQTLRTRIWNMIECDCGGAGTFINWFLFGVIIVSLLALPLQFIPSLQHYSGLFYGVELCTTVILTVEYFLRLYSAPLRAKYIFSAAGIIDLVAALPYYLNLFSFPAPWPTLITSLHALRIFKILHLKSLEEVEREAGEKSYHRNIELLPGEQIEKVALNHPIFLVLGLILPLALGAAGVMVMFFWDFHVWAILIGAILLLFMLLFLYNAWLDYYYDVIYITNYRLIFENKHLIGHSDNQVEYRSITNIRPSHTGIGSTIFGFGNITIETSADNASIEDRHIRDHEKIAALIQRKCQEYTSIHR